MRSTPEGEWRSWAVRNTRLRHLDADLAPPPDVGPEDRRRNWWQVLAIPVIPLLTIAVLAWGAVTMVAAVALGLGYGLFRTLPERGTTRRGLSWLAETLHLRGPSDD